MSVPDKDHALSRIYREGSWPEPSRQIDQAILAASRRAAREQSFVRRWAPSFAVAATVVLTSTLVLKVYREQPEVASPSVPDNQPATRVRQAPPPVEPKVAEAKSTAASPPPAPATPRGFISSMDAGEAERLNRLQRDLGLKQSLPASESPPPAPKSAPAESSAGALKKEISDAPRASPTPRRPELPQGPAASQLREQPASAPISVFGASAPTQQSLRAAAKPALPANQNALSAARTEPVQPQSTGADTMQATAQGARAAPPSPAAAEATAPAPSPAASSDSTSGIAPGAAVAARIAPKVPERSPQTWIEDIRKLVTEGKLAQADRELADFKKRYPDFILPEDLR